MTRSLLILIFISVAATAAKFDLHYKPQGRLIKRIKHELRHRSHKAYMPRGTRTSVKVIKLRQRIQWLERINQYIYHKTNGSKVHPYHQKIEFLKKQLKHMEETETKM